MWETVIEALTACVACVCVGVVFYKACKLSTVGNRLAAAITHDAFAELLTYTICLLFAVLRLFDAIDLLHFSVPPLLNVTMCSVQAVTTLRLLSVMNRIGRGE